MALFDSIRLGASGVSTGYEVERSLRFNTTDQTILTKTLSTSPTNRKKTTLSFWFKKSKLSTSQGVITSGASGTGGSASGTRIHFNSNDTIKVATQVSNSTVWVIDTNRVFRDPSAWTHFCMSLDTTQSTASNRVKIYINGVQETSFSSASYPSQNYDDIWAYGNYRIGDYGGDYGYYVGYQSYIAEVITIDGQSLDPSSFTETNATTGQLIPKDPSSLTFGTNGFHLKFADNSGTTATTLGKDSSSNGNNFTPNNFAVSDAVKDTPTNNFCTFNPLSNYDNSTLSQGNLKGVGTGSDHNWQQLRGTMGVSSGKWYFEIRCNSIAATEGWIGGIHEVFGRDTDGYWWYNGSYTAADFGYAYGVQDNNQRRTNGGSDNTFSSDVTAGKVVGVRMDLDNNEILISVDGVDKGKMYDIQAGITYAPAINIYSTSSATLNCGQDSTFDGQETAGGNTDSAGIGDFAYAVPSGYKALCSANLPNPTILLPDKHFDTTFYTGNNSSQEISTLNFQPDWLWFKNRGGTNWHALFDSVRGRAVGLASNKSNSEYTSSASEDLVSFDNDGFSVGANSNWGSVNGSGNNIVTWAWNGGDTDGKTYTVKVVSDGGNKYRFDDFGTSAVTLDLAEGGTYIFDQSDSSNSNHPLRFSTTSNGTHGGGSEYTTGVTTSGTPGSSGAFTKIVVAASAPTLYYYCTQHSGMGGQANTNSTLGSSNFDGTIQSTAKVNASAGFSIVSWTIPSNAVYTIGHGLGVAPKAIFMKARNQTTNWDVFHAEVGNTKRIKLNSDAAPEDYTGPWNDTDPTSTVFTSTGSWLNGANSTVVAYVFSEVAGYSKFGKYVANGSSDGPFVNLGFTPAWIMTKRTNTSGVWEIHDNKRPAFNPHSFRLLASSADSEATSNHVDFVSNGFKIRNTFSGMNDGNGNTYLFVAFAESPLKNARAR